MPGDEAGHEAGGPIQPGGAPSSDDASRGANAGGGEAQHDADQSDVFPPLSPPGDETQRTGPPEGVEDAGDRPGDETQRTDPPEVLGESKKQLAGDETQRTDPPPHRVGEKTELTLTMPGVPQKISERLLEEDPLKPTDFERRMVELAVEIDLATAEAVEECIAELGRVRVDDPDKPFRDVLIERQVLTESQITMLADAVRDEMSGSLGRLGGFQLLAKLGAGGMGTVYKAKQLALDRIVGLKILPEHLADNHEFVSRFEREVRAAAKLDHPNVVRAFDAGKISGKYYLAMEFVEGETLEKLIREKGRLPEAEAIGLAIQAARGLEAAWHSNLVHRDIKPENILIANDGTAKIADLGLAREIAGAVGAHLTQDGTAIGTPHYISPEQARGSDVDIRSDIFSLGVSIYRMVTGEYPFKGKEPIAIIMARFRSRAVPAREVCPEVSVELSRVIDAMMAIDRDHRYPNPAVLLHDLELLAKGKDPEYASESEASRTRAIKAAELREMSTAAFTVLERRKRSWGTMLIGAVVVVAAFVVSMLTIPNALTNVPMTNGVVAPEDSAEAKALEERARREREVQVALEKEAAAAFAKAEALHNDGKHAEAIASVDETAGKYSKTPYGPRFDALRKRAVSALEEEKALERERIDREKRYAGLIAGARAELAKNEHARASDLLRRARAIKDSDEVKFLFAEAERQQLVGRARGFEEDGEHDEALPLYRKALAMRADEGVQRRIEEIERRLALAERTARGDGQVTEEKWREARATFVEALGLSRGDERGPVQRRIDRVDAELRYLKLVADAAAAVGAKDYEGGLALAKQASAMKPDEEEPKRIARRAVRGIGPPAEITNSLGMKFALVPGGEFAAGSDEGAPHERPERTVSLAPYYVGVHEVTNLQFERFEPSHKQKRGEHSPADDTPVVEVSWYDAVDFCKWLTREEGVEYRLPTEAEWERAARGTDARTFPWGDGPVDDGGSWRCNCASPDGGGEGDGHRYASPVGAFPLGVSPSGAHDMAGNVWEWCRDWYGGSYFATAPAENPPGPEVGKQRVIRGGGFGNDASALQTWRRTAHKPTFTEASVGFRCVRMLDAIYCSGPDEEDAK